MIQGISVNLIQIEDRVCPQEREYLGAFLAIMDPLTLNLAIENNPSSPIPGANIGGAFFNLTA